MSAKLRASSLPSQAGLMRMRGDLRGTSARFRVQLDKPSPATIYSDPISRIGMEVKRHDSKARLIVNDVDENPRQRTPVAQWNTAEERQADRGDEEQHASLAIKPGDRIKAVNDHNSATLMLSELQEAAKPEEPRPVNLEVSRDISNVLAPSPPKPKTSASVPALIPEGGPSSMSRPPKPPRRAVHRTSRYAKGRPSRLDVRDLLQKAGLILPEPTETFVSESEDDSLEIEAPITLLQQGLSQRLTEVIGEIEENWPSKEAVVPEDEETELETPLQNLDVPLQWPLSALFPGVLEEAFESTETWTDLLLPLLDAESVLVDSMDETNYVTVTLEKPLGIQIEENPPQLGGGVAVKSIIPGSQLIQPGYQLLAASGIAVHGLHLEDASRPIEAAQGRVQITFFNGSAETWPSSKRQTQVMAPVVWDRTRKVQGHRGLAPKKSWSWALELLEELRSQSGVDVQTLHSAYGAAMEACQRASRWEPALELLSEIRRLPKTRPTAANYRSAILACERAGEMLKALWLLEEMLEAGLKPDRATYNSAVGACRAILRTLTSQSKSMSPARGDRGRSVTESGWRASSRSKDLPSVQLPGMPIQWDAGIDLQLRSRNASPGPSLAAKRRAVSVGSFERQVTRSSSQGALSSAGFHALRS
eukprot:s1259_g10.t1